MLKSDIAQLQKAYEMMVARKPAPLCHKHEDRKSKKKAIKIYKEQNLINCQQSDGIHEIYQFRGNFRVTRVF